MFRYLLYFLFATFTFVFSSAHVKDTRAPSSGAEQQHTLVWDCVKAVIGCTFSTSWYDSPATSKGKQKHLHPPETSQKNTTATTPAEKQPVKTEADIDILMDSNGKFLQGERLFPGRKTTKLWCPKTGDALRILSDSSFGTPSHIIIHTGTNDLRREQERVGQLRRLQRPTPTQRSPSLPSYPAETSTQTPFRESTLTSPKDVLACPMCTWLITPPSQSETCTTMYT